MLLDQLTHYYVLPQLLLNQSKVLEHHQESQR
jgi:hypothetical protein